MNSIAIDLRKPVLTWTEVDIKCCECFRAVIECYSTLFNFDDSFNILTCSEYKHYKEKHSMNFLWSNAIE